MFLAPAIHPTNRIHHPANYSDLYGDRFVSQGGCGELDSWSLCHFSLPAPSTPEVIIPGIYGGHNSIWGDKVFVDMAKTTGGNAIYMFGLP